MAGIAVHGREGDGLARLAIGADQGFLGALALGFAMAFVAGIGAGKAGSGAGFGRMAVRAFHLLALNMGKVVEGDRFDFSFGRYLGHGRTLYTGEEQKYGKRKAGNNESHHGHTPWSRSGLRAIRQKTRCSIGLGFALEGGQPLDNDVQVPVTALELLFVFLPVDLDLAQQPSAQEFHVVFLADAR